MKSLIKLFRTIVLYLLICILFSFIVYLYLYILSIYNWVLFFLHFSLVLLGYIFLKLIYLHRTFCLLYIFIKWYFIHSCLKNFLNNIFYFVFILDFDLGIHFNVLKNVLDTINIKILSLIDTHSIYVELVLNFCWEFLVFIYNLFKFIYPHVGILWLENKKKFFELISSLWVHPVSVK